MLEPNLWQHQLLLKKALLKHRQAIQDLIPVVLNQLQVPNHQVLGVQVLHHVVEDLVVHLKVLIHLANLRVHGVVRVHLNQNHQVHGEVRVHLNHQVHLVLRHAVHQVLHHVVEDLVVHHAVHQVLHHVVHLVQADDNYDIQFI